MKSVFYTLTLALSFSSMCQTTLDIDSIFREFHTSDHPAVAATVIHKGQVIYQKAFGSESMDSKRPATVNSKFHIAQLSRHIVAYAIFLLEERDKLSLEDDIRKYLNDLPAYNHTVRVRHLLEQTSGFPDIYTLKLLLGKGENEPFSREDTYNIIQNVQLAFEPGSDYQYSDTDEILLALIIEKVTQQSFEQWMSENLFQPLNMSNTFFTNEALSNQERSVPYFKVEDQWIINEIIRPVNLYSTIADLATWELNLLNPKVGSQAIIDKMNEQVVLKNGSQVYPSYGKVHYSQRYGSKERGMPERYRMGHAEGHQSTVFTFPTEEFTVIVLSSGMGYSGYLGIHTAYLFLEDKFPKPERVDYENLPLAKVSKKAFESYEGTYWDLEGHFTREIKFENDTLRYMRPGRSSDLLPIGKGQFQMIMPFDDEIFVQFDDTGMKFKAGESNELQFEKLDQSIKARDLNDYVGIYLNPSLQLTYQIKLENEKLVARNLVSGSFELSHVNENLFQGDEWFFRSVNFQEGPNGEITGFEFYAPGTRFMNFQKVGLNPTVN